MGTDIIMRLGGLQGQVFNWLPGRTPRLDAMHRLAQAGDRQARVAVGSCWWTESMKPRVPAAGRIRINP